MLIMLIHSLTKGSLIRFLVNLFCICLLYLFFYIIYRSFKLLMSFKYLEKKRLYLTIPTFALIDFVLWIISYISMLIVIILGTMFIILFLIWKAIRSAGFGFIIDNVPLFKDCRETGLFPFLDRLFDIIFSNERFTKRLEGAGYAMLEFFATFMKESFGIVFDGYEFDEEYFKDAWELYKDIHETDDEQVILEKKKLFKEKTEGKLPIVKVHFNDKAQASSELNAMQNAEYNNCVKNAVQNIPEDVSRATWLKMIYANEMAKRNCYCEITKNCFDPEGNFADMYNKTSESLQNSFQTLKTEFISQYDNNVKNIEKTGK